MLVVDLLCSYGLLWPLCFVGATPCLQNDVSICHCLVFPSRLCFLSLVTWSPPFFFSHAQAQFSPFPQARMFIDNFLLWNKEFNPLFSYCSFAPFPNPPFSPLHNLGTPSFFRFCCSCERPFPPPRRWFVIKIKFFLQVSPNYPPTDCLLGLLLITTPPPFFLYHMLGSILHFCCPYVYTPFTSS